MADVASTNINSQATDDTHQLTRVQKLAYGAGDLNAAIAAAMTGFFLQPFLLDIAGLRPALVGIIFLIMKLWDAVTDPLVGNLADHTDTKWGRKRAWLLFGAVPFGLTFWLVWYVPGFGTWALFAYYLVMNIALRTAFTAVNVPYTALTPELTDDYDGRTQLTTYRFSFSLLGGLSAIVLHAPLVALAGENNPELGHMISATVWSIVIIASAWVCYVFTFERPKAKNAPKEEMLSPLGVMRLIFNNKPYLYIVAIYLLSWMAVQMVQVNLLLYLRYWFDDESVFQILAIVIQVTAFVFLAVWGRVSQTYGKHQVYAMGASIWLVVMIAIYFIQPQQFWFLAIATFFAGVGTSVAYLMPWSMLPDAIEYNELHTGSRHEGVFYGYFVFFQKMGIALGIAFSSFVLDVGGYVPAIRVDQLSPEAQAIIQADPDNAVGAVINFEGFECEIYRLTDRSVNCNQPETVQQMLRIFVSIVPAVLLTLSLPLAIFFPLTRETFVDIQEQLKKRKNDQRTP
jgi:glycoside/pentoside/hexuronide:cation symporter, GPH family